MFVVHAKIRHVCGDVRCINAKLACKRQQRDVHVVRRKRIAERADIADAWCSREQP